MVISLNWLKKYLSTDLDIDNLLNLIGTRLVEIESVNSLVDRYSLATVVRVVECIDHPDSDHLHICKIDDNNRIDNVSRDRDNLIQVVCGAPNVHADMLAVWLPPNSIVPASYDTKEPFKLSVRKLRGVSSQGMMASPKELDLWDDHKGIIELDHSEAKPGESLIDVLDLNDHLIEVENKSLTHRPDCFGVIGFAREVGAITKNKASIPDWFNNISSETGNISNSLASVKIVDSSLCSRYECAVINNINNNKNLPLKMRSYLSRSGIRPDLAAVDITNYLMLETGQPLHAFDFDKLVKLSPTNKVDIIVRPGKDGEKLELIDGKIINLTANDIVIAVGNTKDSVPIALAGAMGGKNSEIDDSTKCILLESASFDLYRLRATQFRHGIFSEAITRFTKGQPSRLTHPVIAKAIDMLIKYTDAKLESDIIDCYPNESVPVNFTLSVNDVKDIIGQADFCDIRSIVSTLTDLDYKDIDIDNDTIKFSSPWWRTDLNIKEDVIEDIGRINGFDNIQVSLPKRSFIASQPSKLYKMQMLMRQRLQSVGGNEVVLHSFVHGDLLDKVNDEKAKAYRLTNAISPKLQYYRRNLLPGLALCAQQNLKAGYNDFVLFEIGKIHQKGLMDEFEPNLPQEINQLGVIVTSNNTKSLSPYYQAKRVLEYALNIKPGSLEYMRLDNLPNIDSENNIFEPKRSAEASVNGEVVAYIGEINSVTAKALKLPQTIAVFYVLLDKLDILEGYRYKYCGTEKYQGTARDITIQSDLNYSQIDSYVRDSLDSLAPSLKCKVSPLDLYKPNDSVRNVTLHLDFYDPRKTIDSGEVNQIMDKLSISLSEKLGAKVI